MNLKERLIILKNAGQIDNDIYNKVLNVICMFKDKVNIELEESNGAMLVTHLAVALQRIKNGELIHEIEECIYNEILNDEDYEKSVSILKEIENIVEMEIPVCEGKFIIVHLCTLFKTNK